MHFSNSFQPDDGNEDDHSLKFAWCVLSGTAARIASTVAQSLSFIQSLRRDCKPGRSHLFDETYSCKMSVQRAETTSRRLTILMTWGRTPD